MVGCDEGDGGVGEEAGEEGGEVVGGRGGEGVDGVEEEEGFCGGPGGLVLAGWLWTAVGGAGQDGLWLCVASFDLAVDAAGVG